MDKFLRDVKRFCTSKNVPAREIELELRAGPFNKIERWPAVCDVIAQLDKSAAVTIVNDFSISANDTSRNGVRFLARRKIESGGDIMLIRKTNHCMYRFAAAYPLRIACSREENIESWSIPNDADMRLRARRSVTIGDWRIDLTRVVQITKARWSANRPMMIKFYDEGLFAQYIDKDNEAKGKLDEELVELYRLSAIEVEAEYVGNICAQINVQAALDIVAQLVAPIDELNSNSVRANIVSFIASLRARMKIQGRRSNEPQIMLKGVMNNAFSITRNTYLRDYWPFDDYYVTEKADGERAVAAICTDDSIVIVSDTTVYGTFDKSRRINTLYDGEVIVARDGNITLYAFDCLYANGKSVCDKPFSERRGMIEAFRDNGLLHIRAKVFVHIAREIDSAVMRATIEGVWNGARDYAIDGLIFTQGRANYFATLNIKWKPMNKNTIDFYVIVAPPEWKRAADEIIYLLYVTCSEDQRNTYCLSQPRAYDPPGMALFECRFAPQAYIYSPKVETSSKKTSVPKKKKAASDAAEPNVIIENTLPQKPFVAEMIWDAKTDSWSIVRVREDRTAGNNIKIATDVFANYIDPFPIEALWNPGKQYFEHDSDTKYVASNKFRRFVITDITYHQTVQRIPIDENAGLIVLDVGGGRAQDYSRFALLGASRVINIDIDPGAIVESVARVNTIQERRNKKMSLAEQWLRDLGVENIGARRYKRCRWPAYFAQVLDFAHASPIEIETLISRCVCSKCIKRINIINFSFSFHYLCEDQASIIRAFHTFDRILTPDGIIFITTMNGERVRELLRTSQDHQWIARNDDGTNRYVIRSIKNDYDLREFGSMIEVSVPFARDLYTEPICNFRAIDELAREYGFTCALAVEHDDARLASFAAISPQMGSSIDEIDRMYGSLFDTRVYVRKV